MSRLHRNKQYFSDASWTAEQVRREINQGLSLLNKIENEIITIFGSHRVSPGSHYYEHCRKLAYLLGKKGFAIITGGGPGIMQAANFGATQAQVPSIGLRAELLKGEQVLDPIYTDELSFHFLFVRRFIMSIKSEALIFYPGGYGTLNEIFEYAVLMQNKIVDRVPIFCVNRPYWQGLFDWLTANPLKKDFLKNKLSDLKLIHFVDSADEILDVIANGLNTKNYNVNNRIYVHFSKTVDDYDILAEKVVMKNDELQEVLVNSIPFHFQKPIKVLDLGSGTGRGMFLVIKKFPNAKVTGIDFSKKMIIKSSKKLKRFKERFNLIEANFNVVELGENYDAIVSAIAIHNNTHQEKKKLFEKIYKSLKKGGIFINGDFIEGETVDLDKKYQSIYKEYLIKNLRGNELKVWLRHVFKEDRPMRLSKQFTLLKNIGFKKIKLIWQLNNEAVYLTYK